MNPSRLFTPLIGALAVVLVGCATTADEGVTPTSTITITSTSAAATESPRVDTAREAYTGVLDNPQEYSFDTGADYNLTGDYRYALAEITGDSTPELLLLAEDVAYVNPIRIFSISETGSLIAPRDTLISGARGAGGYRAGVSASPDGNRIFQQEWVSLRDDISVRGFILDGDRLLPSGEEFQDSVTAPSNRLVEITFHPLSDRSPLTALGPTALPHAAPAPTTDEEEAPGYTASGTVRVMTAPQLASYQGSDGTPNGEDDTHRFALLILDSPTMITALKSGSPHPVRPQEATMIKLGEMTPYASNPRGFNLDGQRVSISYVPEDCWFPSDTGMPLGEPRCDEFSFR